MPRRQASAGRDGGSGSPCGPCALVGSCAEAIFERRDRAPPRRTFDTRYRTYSSLISAVSAVSMRWASQLAGSSAAASREHVPAAASSLLCLGVVGDKGMR